MSEELKKLEELLANDRKIIEDNYKEIERLTKQNKALNEMYELTKKEYIRLNNIIKEQGLEDKPNYYVKGLEGSLKEYQEEVERLNNKNEELLTLYTTEREVKDYYKNIINELEHDFESYELEYLQDTYQGSLADFIETELERLQELKGSDKE